MVGWLVEHRCRFISYYNGKIVVVVMTAVMVDITITTIIKASCIPGEYPVWVFYIHPI